MESTFLVMMLCMCANAQFVHEDQQYHLQSSYAPLTTRRENIFTTAHNYRPVTPVAVNVTDSNKPCNACGRLQPYVIAMCSVAFSLCFFAFCYAMVLPVEEERNDNIKPH